MCLFTYLPSPAKQWIPILVGFLDFIFSFFTIFDLSNDDVVDPLAPID